MATKAEITIKITNNILAKTPEDQITPQGVAEILTDIMNLIPDNATTLSGNTLTLPDGQSIVIEPDTAATINSGIITFADGTIANLGSIDTDTFATIENGVITTADGSQHSYSENDTFAIFDGDTIITFADNQVLDLSQYGTPSLDEVTIVGNSTTNAISVGGVSVSANGGVSSILGRLLRVKGDNTGSGLEINANTTNVEFKTPINSTQVGTLSKLRLLFSDNSSNQDVRVAEFSGRVAGNAPIASDEFVTLQFLLDSLTASSGYNLSNTPVFLNKQYFGKDVYGVLLNIPDPQTGSSNYNFAHNLNIGKYLRVDVVEDGLPSSSSGEKASEELVKLAYDDNAGFVSLLINSIETGGYTFPQNKLLYIEYLIADEGISIDEIGDAAIGIDNTEE